MGTAKKGHTPRRVASMFPAVSAPVFAILQSLKVLFPVHYEFLGAVYMEAGLARLARQPGKRDEFVLCLYEKNSSRLPG